MHDPHLAGAAVCAFLPHPTHRSGPPPGSLLVLPPLLCTNFISLHRPPPSGPKALQCPPRPPTVDRAQEALGFVHSGTPVLDLWVGRAVEQALSMASEVKGQPSWADTWAFVQQGPGTCVRWPPGGSMARQCPRGAA